MYMKQTDAERVIGPLTLTLSPAFAEAASRRQAQGERGLILFPLP